MRSLAATGATALTATNLGHPSSPATAQAIREAVDGRLGLLALSARLAEDRRSRLAAHLRPGPGLGPVTVPAGDDGPGGLALRTLLAIDPVDERGSSLAGAVALVRRVRRGTAPRLQLTSVPDPTGLLGDLAAARRAGLLCRPVLRGPLALLQAVEPPMRIADGRLLGELAERYAVLLRQLADGGARSVQLDEPALARPLLPAEAEALVRLHRALAARPRLPQITLTAAPGSLHRGNVGVAARTGAAVVHLDLVRDPGLLAAAVAELRRGQRLALGLVPGGPHGDVDDSLLRMGRMLLDDALLDVAPARPLSGVAAAGRLRSVARLATRAAGPGDDDLLPRPDLDPSPDRRHDA